MTQPTLWRRAVKSWWLRSLILIGALGAVIIPQSNSVPLPDFSQYQDVRQKKTAFFNYMLPLVTESNRQTLEQRAQLEMMAGKAQLSAAERKMLSQFASQYGLQSETENPDLLEKLLLRVDKIPASLALSQAAIESAWGTSRFAVQGNNLFGQWCYKKGCGLVPLRRNAGSNHEVAKFSSVADAVSAYMRNINSHRAYSDLRDNRAQLRNTQQQVTGHLLAENLLHYSELREVYVHEVQAVIRVNKLAQYD
ncbi:glucosaminidase domain-containing protein [Porticoccaceae bacterium]|jgi:Bax protein|nr:glucosaminidase domain-containing protein [Porticoccaceae bacterium]MDB3966941.1 glucosaminidase domain-containing protein [Porticoccaceae bacterium]